MQNYVIFANAHKHPSEVIDGDGFWISSMFYQVIWWVAFWFLISQMTFIDCWRWWDTFTQWTTAEVHGSILHIQFQGVLVSVQKTVSFNCKVAPCLSLHLLSPSNYFSKQVQQSSRGLEKNLFWTQTFPRSDFIFHVWMSLLANKASWTTLALLDPALPQHSHQCCLLLFICRNNCAGRCLQMAGAL